MSALTPARIDSGWLWPAEQQPAEPRWGHPRGLQIGLHPLSGPRGLIRLYAPYLDHPADRVINFIAVEPIPAGATARGYSELEQSSLDGVQGKRFQGSLPSDADPAGQQTVWIEVEPFDNGARVAVRARFRADRPHEVGLAVFRQPGSVALDRCILSATMGNFARLRRLELADRDVSPEQWWPGFAGEHFTEHGVAGLSRLTRTAEGDALVSAIPDEPDPQTADYAAGTAEHWKYLGRTARQSWRAPDPDPQLLVQVNGRHCYWKSDRPIPGGTAYENFELSEPFRDGREMFFSIEPVGPISPASP